MILGTICARGGSKGIPRKNVRPLSGTPLIALTISQAIGWYFDRIIVSTDDEEIVKYCPRAPGLHIQMRPAELATDTASKWDVFRYITEQNNLKPDDILVDLDTGCPLRELQDISACVKKLGEGFDVVATAYESDRNPYFNMVVKAGDEWVVCADCDYSPIGYKPVTRRQDAPVVYSLSPAVFAIKVSALVECDHWSQSRLGIVVIPRERGWDIDSELDFRIVEFLMKGK